VKDNIDDATRNISREVNT